MSPELRLRISGAPQEFSIDEYLALCKKDPSAYASAHERMLTAIGKPNILVEPSMDDTLKDLQHNTFKDPRLSRIFHRRIPIYPAFADFHGVEEVIEQIVAYIQHAAQGLEARKQILYLLGPVGCGKSSIVERLKELMGSVSFYAIKGSPVFESPLGLFHPSSFKYLSKEYGIPMHILKRQHLSPWAAKRMIDAGDDMSQIRIVKLDYSELLRIGIAKIEPGDDYQGITSLVGQVDERKDAPLDDPDCYAYTGALCKGTQGIVDIVEMSKFAPKVLNPLLTATQEGNYNAHGGAMSLPFNGIIVAHSNEAEWRNFKDNKNNAAFLDRVYMVKVPYCLRVSDVVEIYKKFIAQSGLGQATWAPGTLEMLAKFFVASCMVIPPTNTTTLSIKMRIYNGEDLKGVVPDLKLKTLLSDLRTHAGLDEGMNGLSTRDAFKILSKLVNYDASEIGANPVHLLSLLYETIRQWEISKENQERYRAYINNYLVPEYEVFVEKEIQTAYIASYSEEGQRMFLRYFNLADCWISGDEYRDPENPTLVYTAEILDAELQNIDKGVQNVRDFRSGIVSWVLRQRADKGGAMPSLIDNNKLRELIDARMFGDIEDLLPVVLNNMETSAENMKKHDDFIMRFKQKGYTEKQVKLLISWYLRVSKKKL